MYTVRLLFLFLILTVFAGPGHALKLVANPGVRQQQLTPSAVRAMFNMRLRHWADGTPVRVFVLSDKHPLHRQFTKQFLQVFPNQLRRSWNRRVYSGTGQAPLQVNSVEQMRQRVSQTRGAIGYLPEDEIDERVKTINME